MRGRGNPRAHEPSEVPWRPQWGAALSGTPSIVTRSLSPQPNRTYYLMDPSGNAHKWCKKIQEVWRHRYQSHPDAAVQ